MDQLLAEQQMLLKNSPGKKKPETNLNMVMQNLDINLKQIEKLQSNDESEDEPRSSETEQQVKHEKHLKRETA